MTAMKKQLSSSNRPPGFQRRLLKKNDLERMRLPYRFWESKFDRISEGSTKEMIRKFINGMGHVLKPEKSMATGFGIILWGDNDGGKTSAAAVIAKESRRRGFSTLFVRSTQYRTAVMEKEMFNESTTLQKRCESVDLLVVDDFGKEGSNSKSDGGSERMFEDLLRERTSNKRSTIITMNADPDLLDGRYEKSVQRLLSEAFVILKLAGISQRDIEKQQLIEFFTQE